MSAKKPLSFREIYERFGPERMNWISDLTRPSAGKPKLFATGIQAQPEEPVEPAPLPDISQMSDADLGSHPQVQQYAQTLGMTTDELITALRKTPQSTE
jgi:hypothetical protein